VTASRGGPPSNAAVRGGLLILAAVLVGALLLSRGFSEDGGVVASADGDDTTETTVADSSGETTDTTAAATTDTTAATDGGTTDTTAAAPTVRPNEETKFIVLNGTTTNGAANDLSGQLSALGYVPGGTGNVSGGADASGIYFVEGWQPEAENMATELGVGVELVSPLPAPFEWPMDDSAILVVIGIDGLIAPT
jgi:LytR cell envelope-related transcriptional attenuator